MYFICETGHESPISLCPKSLNTRTHRIKPAPTTPESKPDAANVEGQQRGVLGEYDRQSSEAAPSAAPEEACAERGHGKKGAEGPTPRVIDIVGGGHQEEKEEEEFSEWRVHPRVTPRKDMALQVG